MTKIKDWNVGYMPCHICVSESGWMEYIGKKVIWDYDVEGHTISFCKEHLIELIKRIDA